MFLLVLILESGHKHLNFPGPSFYKLTRVSLAEQCLQRKQGREVKCLPQALGPRDVTKPTSQVLEACSSSLSLAHA